MLNLTQRKLTVTSWSFLPVPKSLKHAKRFSKSDNDLNVAESRGNWSQLARHGRRQKFMIISNFGSIFYTNSHHISQFYFVSFEMEDNNFVIFCGKSSMVYRQPNTQHVQYRHARETLQKAFNNHCQQRAKRN